MLSWRSLLSLSLPANHTGNATVDIYNPEVMPPFIPLTDSIMLPAPGCAPEQVRARLQARAHEVGLRAHPMRLAALALVAGTSKHIHLRQYVPLPDHICAFHTCLQVRLTYWSSTATKVNFLVTFATCGYQYNDSVAGPQAPPKTPPYVWVGNADGVYKTRFTGVTTSYLGNFTDTGGSK